VGVNEFLDLASRASVLVFVVSCMAAAGLGLTVRALVAPLRRGRLVLVALLANFLIAPALAYALTVLVPLDRPYAIGLLLLGGAAGAPFLPKLVELAGGDVAFSVGLMLLLMVGSVVFMPLVLPFMIPGLAADPWPLLRPLLLTMMLPLAAGMAVRNRSERWSSLLRPVFAAVSNLSMLAAVLLLITLNFQAMLGTFGSGAAVVAVVFVVLSLSVGYLLGGPDPATRSVLGLGTGQRNIAAALLIATQNFAAEPGVVVMLLVSTFAGLAVLLLAARRFGRRVTVQRATITVPLESGAAERPDESFPAGLTAGQPEGTP
jgi:predicted Na+-dependent transporter